MRRPALFWFATVLCILLVASDAAHVIGRRDAAAAAAADDDKKDDPEHDADDDDGDGGGGDGHGDIHWSYLPDDKYGPSNWVAVSATCNSSYNRQSPIDIVTEKTVLDESLGELTIAADKTNRTGTAILTNNGHSVNLVFGSTLRVIGGGLKSSFRVAGAHFHWGKTDADGSEHTIDGKHFPLEMHVVSYDDGRFGSLKEAVDGDNGLAVVGVLFEISPTDNPRLEPVIAALDNVTFPGMSTEVNLLEIHTLAERNLYRFYRYEGSLTTPPCSETVVWTVLDKKQRVSSKQVDKFRTLRKDASGEVASLLTFNWRATQPIQDRVVTRSFSTDLKPEQLPEKQPEQPASAAAHLHRNQSQYAAFALVLLLVLFVNDDAQLV